MKQVRNPLTGRWNKVPEDKSWFTFKVLVVDTLPEIGEEGIVYIVKGPIFSNMYIRDWTQFVKIGTTQWSPQVQADREEIDETSMSYIKNKPVLAEVCFTNSYESLDDKPEIPVVNDSQIDVDINGTVQSFTLNQDEWKTINVEIPTKTSDLENDVPFAEVDDIPTKVSELQNDSEFITKEVNNLTNYTKTIDLGTVALSNDYTDLSNKPTIPTKVSDLQNDIGFITHTVNNLTNYYTASQTYTRQQIDNLISGVAGLRLEMVAVLPNPWETGVIYLMESSTPGVYEQYILTAAPNTYQMIGTTAADLSQYFNKTTDTADNINDGANKVIMTTAERTNLSNQSWTNTGDETKASIQTKLGAATASNDWYLKKEDWSDFDEKADYDDFAWVEVTGTTISINNPNTHIESNANIRVNVWASVKSGLVYLLRVSATDDIHITLGTGISNEVGTDLNIPNGDTKIFVMLATSSTTLEMQWVDMANFVSAGELARVAFTGSFNDLSNVPSQQVVWDGTITLKQWTETLWTFTTNQSSNKTINIQQSWYTGNMIYTKIGECLWWITTRFNHPLWKLPRYIDIEAYIAFWDDDQGRHTASRALISRENWNTEFLGTIFHFSDGRIAWGPSDIESLPMTIAATSSQIVIYSQYYAKVRITAYL